MTRSRPASSASRRRSRTRSVALWCLADDPSRKPIELVAPFERAKSLARRAMFDEAAVAFDELIGRALRAPQRVDAPAQLISSMVARISIAIARHEPRRASELLDRLLRFDPAVSLPADEDEPGIHAQLQIARKKLGPQPTIGADELGAACRAADVLVVARTLEGGRVELTRFDDCRQVARIEIVGGDDHAAAAALAPSTLPHGSVELTPANPPAVAHEVDSSNAVATPPVDLPARRSNARAERIAGWATIGVGAGALVLGATFAGLAKATSDDITHPAAGAVWSEGLQDRLHVYEALDTAFFVHRRRRDRRRHGGRDPRPSRTHAARRPRASRLSRARCALRSSAFVVVEPLRRRELLAHARQWRVDRQRWHARLPERLLLRRRQHLLEE